MELKDAIYKRRTIRDFTTRNVPAKTIHKIIEAGLKAPSYNHLKQWDFILVNDETKRYELTQTETMPEQVTEDIKRAFKDYDQQAREMYLDAIPKQKKMIMQAPELLVVVYKPKMPVEEWSRIYDLNCLASVWCCIENMLLTMAEEDIYGVTFIPKNTKGVKSVLNIPDEYEVGAIIPFGYKGERTKIFPQKQVSVQDRLHKDSWGNF